MERGGSVTAVYFREVQRFAQWWIWVIVVGIAVLMWDAFIQQILLGRPFGDNPAPNAVLIVFFLIFGIGMPWLFIVVNLRTVVRADGIYVRFYPFHLRDVRIAPETIVSAAAGSYNPLLDYGGWGIRMGRGGRAYNASGNQGVRLELTSGQHLLIGSQRAPELAAAIERLLAGRGD
jgi:hypothetical protein